MSEPMCWVVENADGPVAVVFSQEIADKLTSALGWVARGSGAVVRACSDDDDCPVCGARPAWAEM